MHENAVRKKLHRFTEETTLIPSEDTRKTQTNLTTIQTRQHTRLLSESLGYWPTVAVASRPTAL